MSEYGYDAYGNPIESGAGEPSQEQGPKWFRDQMEKVSGQLKQLQEENQRLQREQAQAKVQEAFKAKGYTPEAAQLYQGEPTGVDDWLATHGNALARLPGTAGEEPGESEGQQAPQGPPQSSVPADLQAQMQAFAEAGTNGAAAPQGSDKELAAQIKNASPEEYARLMGQHGNRYNWT